MSWSLRTQIFQFYHKPELHILNETVRDDFKYLSNLRPGDSPVVVDYSQGKFEVA